MKIKKQQFSLPVSESCPISETIREGLDCYLNQGIIPGGFLTAVLENDLKEAFGRADYENAENMRNIVAYLYNYVPSVAWGNRERMVAFIEHFHGKEAA